MKGVQNKVQSKDDRVGEKEQERKYRITVVQHSFSRQNFSRKKWGQNFIMIFQVLGLWANICN
jgi:hypothetical protein